MELRSADSELHRPQRDPVPAFVSPLASTVNINATHSEGTLVTGNDADRLNDEGGAITTTDTTSHDEIAVTQDISGYGFVRRPAESPNPDTSDLPAQHALEDDPPPPLNSVDAPPEGAIQDPVPNTGRHKALAIGTRIGAIIGALALGVALGFVFDDPTSSPEYRTVAAERDGANETATQLQSEVDQLESEVTRLQDKVDGLEEEVAGVAERETAVAEAEEAVAAREAAATERESALAQREAAVGIAEEQQKANSFPGSGTFRVGTDIQPGTYTAAGSDLCYWARLSSLSGDFSAIITNHVGSGPQVVTIRDSDAGFETKDCGTWTRQ